MRKSAIIIIVLVVSAALAISVMPFGIQRIAVGWLEDQGVSKRSIDNVDFNPFTGTLRFELTNFSGDADQRGEVGLAELDFEWTGLFNRRAMLSGFTLRNAQIDIQQLEDGRYLVGGLSFPLPPGEATQEDEPSGSVLSGFGITDVVLEDVAITYRDQRIHSRLTVKQLSIDQLTTWGTDSVTRLLAELELDGSAITLEADILPFAAEPGVVASSLSIDQLALAPYGALLAVAGVEEPGAILSAELHSNAVYQQDGTVKVQLAGDVNVDQIEAILPIGRLGNHRLHWSGDLTAAVPAGPAGALELAGTTDLNVSGFSLHALEQPITLVKFDELAVDDVLVHSLDRMEIGRLSTHAIAALQRDASDEATLSIGTLLLETIGITGRTALNIERARLDAVLASIVRRKDGQLALVSDVMADFTPPVTDDPPASGSQSDAGASSTDTLPPPVTFYIALLEIGADSRLSVQDLSVEPPFSTQVELARVQLSRFGNADPGQPAHITMDLTQGDNTTLTVTGDLLLFGDLASDLQVTLKGFDLTDMSAYSPGYHVQRGRLSIDAQAKLHDDALDVSSEVTIEKLQLSGKAAGEQGALGAGMAMPLDVALDLLRDSNDTIALTLPITGSINDPQFGTADIIQKAMQSALQKTAMSYIKNALQPLGTIMFIASIGSELARPRFDPVSFAAGGAELTAQAQQYLEKIATMLQERPALSLTFCGVSTLADRDYLAQAIKDTPPADGPPPAFEIERLELARTRGDAVQKFFVEGHNVAAARLFRCRPMLDAESLELPRVEIML